MTEEELTAIEKRANAATREPWIVGDTYVPTASLSAVSVYGMGMEVAECQMDTDGAFIAAARVDVPALVAEVRSLRAEREALRKDAARLDWLESRSSFLVHQWQGGGYTLTLPQPPVDGVRPPPIGVAGDALRQAIDAAMAVQPSTGDTP